MAFHSTVCPSCHKEIQIPDDADTALCMYCGKSVICRGTVYVSVGPNVSNLLGLARTASAANNVEEAEKYYTQVLEHDPGNSEAWFGKGKSAALQSTLNNIRLGDAVVSFKNAIGASPEDKKGEMLTACVNEINNLAVTIYGMADKHMREFVFLPDAWSSYFDQLYQLTVVLEEVSAWSPEDKTILENIVHFCSVLIEGIQFKDQYDNNAPKVWHLTPEYEALMRDKLTKSGKKIESLDPQYVTPDPKVKKPESSCFVVTATMGDPMHPTVCLLRCFRDQWLMQKTWGKWFVSWYYEHGPKVAVHIRHNSFLRGLSYCLIVIPSAWFARRVLK